MHRFKFEAGEEVYDPMTSIEYKVMCCFQYWCMLIDAKNRIVTTYSLSEAENRFVSKKNKMESQILW